MGTWPPPVPQGHALRATSRILQLPTPASNTPVTMTTKPGQRFVSRVYGPTVALIVTAAVIAQHKGRDHLWLGAKLPDDLRAYLFRYRRKHLGDADPRDPRDELWEEMQWECPQGKPNEGTAYIPAIVCSKDGERVFCAVFGGVAMMRLNREHPEYHDPSHTSAVEDADVGDLHYLSKWYCCGDESTAAVALSPDNERMYSGSMSGHIAIWDNGANLIDGPDVGTPPFIDSVPGSDWDPLDTANTCEPLSALVTDADGRLYSAGRTVLGVSVWDTSGDQLVKIMILNYRSGCADDGPDAHRQITSLTMCPAGRRLYSVHAQADHNNFVDLSDIEGGEDSAYEVYDHGYDHGDVCSCRYYPGLQDCNFCDSSLHDGGYGPPTHGHICVWRVTP